MTKRVTTGSICFFTKYKGGNYSTLKSREKGGGGGENETTPNIKGESNFSIFNFVGETMCFLL